ncbi:MAG: hypothetical protein WC868_13125 [Bacteroidales bacterium]
MTNLVCSDTITNIGDIICKAGSILKLIIPVLILLGIVYFVWGVVTYFINDTEEAKKKGRDKIIYGLLGFVIIFALQGLVTIVINTFGLDQGAGLISNFTQNINPGNIGTNAQGFCDLGADPKLGNLFNYATCFIYSSALPLIIALAVAMFIWGIVQYVINSDEEAKKAKGKQFMIWGLIGLIVMFGVWGIVKIVGNTFGIENAIPQLK